MWEYLLGLSESNLALRDSILGLLSLEIDFGLKKLILGLFDPILDSGWGMGGGWEYISKAYFGVWVFTDAIQYLDPFPFLWAVGLRFYAIGPVVQLRLVVFLFSKGEFLRTHRVSSLF